MFTDRNVRDDELDKVFLPIALGAFRDWSKERIEKIGMIYENMDAAGPRTVNGMPNFFSFRLLHIDQIPELAKLYDRYQQMRTKFLDQ